MALTTFTLAINQAIAEEMERDPLTFLMGEDVVLGPFGATKGLLQKFGPVRVRNTPIAEAGFVGAAVGAAMAGARPICEVEFASFFYCAFDQVCNQAAKLRYMSGGQAHMPITFRALFGALGGAAAQHSETVYAQFLSVPGIKLVVPSGPADMKGLLKSAIRDDNPVIVFEHGGLGRLKEEIPAGDYLVPLGKAAIKRPGKDVTLIAIGAMVSKSLKAAEKLAAEGIDVEIVDPRTLVPLDEDAILSSVEKTNRVVVVDEGHWRGGAAADIAAMSPAAPPRRWPSSTITTRLVFATEPRMVSSSSGISVRGSITSTAIWSRASLSATESAFGTIAPIAITVTSLPSRFTAALPSGTRCSPSGTSSREPPSPPCSNTITGLSSRIALLSRPFMSAGPEGTTSLSPGTPRNCAQTVSECWAAALPIAPHTHRKVSGSRACPPDM